MGNLISGLKRTIGNKNTVTFLGVIVCVAILLFGYNYRVSKAVTPIRVPYAIAAINATQEITEENIGYVEVNSKFLKTADVITSASGLIGYYVNTGTSIPAGGLFYKSQVVEKKELPNTVFDNIPDGYTIYGLPVDNQSTYGNSIYPDDKIDLYINTTDEAGKVIFGKFIESITVLAVRDSNGQNVFDDSENRTPDMLLFAVEDKLYELLMKSSLIGGINVIPVPRNKNYTVTSGEVATQEYFVDLINSKSAQIN